MTGRPIGRPEPLSLPTPLLEGRLTVFEALKVRHTTRDIGSEDLPTQSLSDLLWAAQGINRQAGPFGGTGRTAASASNSQEVLIYVLLKGGTYLYEPESHKLAPVASGDLRQLAIGHGQQPAGAEAPVRLVYVVDLERFRHAGFPEPGLYDPEIQKSYYYVDTGLVAENVYLAAASLGLATWFHNCDKQAFARELGLGPDMRPVFGQTIGLPAGAGGQDR